MKRILIFYSHFTPAYKAGGPVQSIHNMIELIRDCCIIDVVCGAYDLGDKETLREIIPDQWTNANKNLNIFYIKTNGIKSIIAAFNERRPGVVYVNGVFLPLYSWLPLFLAKCKNISVVFAPRGMLQKGALANKSSKKLLSISILKALGLHKNVTWHATDQQEESDIHAHFGNSARVKIVGNVPKPPMQHNSKLFKKDSELKLVYLSLISLKKNLRLVLSVLKQIQHPITFDIYGPVKDNKYWESCLSLIPSQIHSIKYCGLVDPGDVQHTLQKYHAFILLTMGENFGHAIYEALNSGTPAIISQFTPWGNLQTLQAGITVDISDEKSCQLAIENLWAADQERFNMLSSGARQLAKNYYHGRDFRSQYVELFSD